MARSNVSAIHKTDIEAKGSDMAKPFLGEIDPREITVQTPNGTARGRVSQRPDKWWTRPYGASEREAPAEWDGDRSGE